MRNGLLQGGCTGPLTGGDADYALHDRLCSERPRRLGLAPSYQADVAQIQSKPRLWTTTPGAALPCTNRDQGRQANAEAESALAWNGAI
jgi:hypothetical protein